MRTVQLRAGGILYKKEWNADEEKYEYHPIRDDNEELFAGGISHLLFDVEIDDGVTLDDLFIFCSRINPLLTLMLRHDWYSEYMAEWERVRDAAKLDTEMQCIYLHRHVEIDDFDSAGLNLNQGGLLTVSGLNKNVIIKDDGDLDCSSLDENSGTFYGLDFVPLENILGLPIVISKKTYISKTAKNDGKYDRTTEDFNDTGSITLLDVIRSIFFELSFYGGPEEAKKTGEDMKDRMNGVMEAIKNGNITFGNSDAN